MDGDSAEDADDGTASKGFWLYLWPVSRTVRAMYMETLAQGTWDAKWLFKTSIYAAAQSLGTFQLARKRGLPVSVLDGQCACRVVGASRSLELVRAAAKAGDQAPVAGAPRDCKHILAAEQHAHAQHMVAGPAAAAAVAGRIAWREAIVNDMRLLASLRLFNPKLTLMSSRFDAVERAVQLGKVKYAWHARTGADLIPANYLLYT
ncbi:hypothetical protein JKP88DRAFT_265843 [Tribonema minus]|uniref:Uncharacterized protein n=1 Tax=Tribonema minus TaxID=303371 RepID=A0A835YKJ1_9STRA|nr:hypothetical protein JKP88DRAFT_265843 [Tribonema minus]